MRRWMAYTYLSGTFLVQDQFVLEVLLCTVFQLAEAWKAKKQATIDCNNMGSGPVARSSFLFGEQMKKRHLYPGYGHLLYLIY